MTTWWLKLYPSRWRRRYGEEFLTLIGPQRFSLGTALDIIGGAIDAWTEPQSHLSPRRTSNKEEETIMLAKTMRLRSAGYGAKVTMRDGLKGVAVTIGGTLLSVLLAIWMKRKGVHTSYVSARDGWRARDVVARAVSAVVAPPVRQGILGVDRATAVFTRRGHRHRRRRDRRVDPATVVSVGSRGCSH